MVDLFEFTLQKIVGRHLDTYFRVTGATPNSSIAISTIFPTSQSVLLSTLAALGGDEGTPGEGLSHGSRLSSGANRVTACIFKRPENCGLDAIKTSIERFEQSTPIVKRDLPDRLQQDRPDRWEDSPATKPS